MTSNQTMHFLITGAAGFIGFHLAKRLLELGHTVAGLDNLNHYYDPALKTARLEILQEHEAFSFHRLDIADKEGRRRKTVRRQTIRPRGQPGRPGRCALLHQEPDGLYRIEPGGLRQPAEIGRAHV